eukprot:1937620-Prymnesium_polylepis.1
MVRTPPRGLVVARCGDAPRAHALRGARQRAHPVSAPGCETAQVGAPAARRSRKSPYARKPSAVPPC